ncbi:MAG TPA: protein kinase [Kofleriaceae bacterium]|nr:protein kinase [Kofleriaceae bacterium]
MEDDSGTLHDERIGGLVDERYRVLEAMASGSMGVVYKAERVPVGKLVAIKFLHAPFANDDEFLARFERETRVMSKLTHPNCVSVVDFGVWEGAPYLVMEYVSGTTLRALIDNGPLPVRRALALVRQIAAGLAHAHAQGVVHRDVKPANIMISEEIGTGDHARILDFGLARLRGAVGRDATQSNVVVGTPNYMAPEQTVGGGLIDARTDIYAVGVVLFEMVTGERPFQAEDTLALLGMHRAAPIPQLADRAPPGVELPDGLQEVVERAMAKSPGDRYQSAIELAEAIDEVAGGVPSLAGPGASGAVSGRTSRAGRLATGGQPQIRRSAEVKQSMGTAPTMLDLSDAAELVAPAGRLRARSRGSFLGSLLLLAILLGGVGGAVWWIKSRSTARPRSAAARAPGSAVPSAPVLPGSIQAPAAGSAAPAGGRTGVGEPPARGSATASSAAGSAAASPGAGSASVEPAVGSAAIAATPPSEPAREPAREPVREPARVETPPAPEPSAPVADEAVEPPGNGSAGRPPEASGAGAPDIDMDPTTADDPAPASTKPSNDADEAVNAPKTIVEVERHAPPGPALAATLPGAIQQIKDGKRDLALASLRALWKKTPNSSYIPFLLGNLYYDQQWWSVALDHYSVAIKKNAKYRWNPTLNRNVIRMLASNKTSRKAETFLKYSVGKPALPYVRYAALHDANGQVKRLSGWLSKNL